MMSEGDILGRLYPNEKHNSTHKDRLRDLAGQINSRLKELSANGLAASCATVGAGENKSWHLRIEELNEVSSVGYTATETVFQTTTKPEFSWSGQGISLRSREIWLPVHGEDVELIYRVEDAPWSPPAGFSNYVNFREACWKDYQQTYPNCANPRVWHVAGCTPKSDRHGNSCHGIELTVAPIFYKDVVATTFRLDEEIDGDNGKTTIRKWLAGGVRKRIADCHFIPAGNPLLVEVNLITKDGKLIVRQHEDKKKKELRWESAVFAYMDSLTDVYRNALHIPDPSETFFRKCCQLLRLPVQPARVRWLGIGFGLKEGKVSLLGEVEINLTAKELSNQIGKRQKLEVLELTPKIIHEFCSGNKIRAHAEALLVLSLKQRHPKVKIVTTVPKQKAK